MNRKKEKIKKNSSRKNTYLVKRRGATMKDEQPRWRSDKVSGMFQKQKYRRNVVKTKLFPESLVKFPKEHNL